MKKANICKTSKFQQNYINWEKNDKKVVIIETKYDKWWIWANNHLDEFANDYDEYIEKIYWGDDCDDCNDPVYEENENYAIHDNGMFNILERHSRKYKNNFNPKKIIIDLWDIIIKQYSSFKYALDKLTYSYVKYLYNKYEHFDNDESRTLSSLIMKYIMKSIAFYDINKDIYKYNDMFCTFIGDYEKNGSLKKLNCYKYDTCSIIYNNFNVINVFKQIRFDKSFKSILIYLYGANKATILECTYLRKINEVILSRCKMIQHIRDMRQCIFLTQLNEEIFLHNNHTKLIKRRHVEYNKKYCIILAIIVKRCKIKLPYGIYEIIFGVSR
jgi:hypothetical protein